MKSISIDSEVYDFIKNNAEPFVDSPNSVLRRLLLGEAEVGSEADNTIGYPQKGVVTSTKNVSGGAAKFVNQFLASRFDGEFSVRSPYRMMFESDNQIVYFQNFNKKGTSNLWYRLNPTPMSVLRSSEKEGFVCLTNPAEEFGFVLPLQEIEQHTKSVGWNRDELEVNIDPADSRWRELSWNLEPYLYHLC